MKHLVGSSRDRIRAVNETLPPLPLPTVALSLPVSPILPPPPWTATTTTTNTLTTSTEKSNNNLYLHSRGHCKNHRRHQCGTSSRWRPNTHTKSHNHRRRRLHRRRTSSRWRHKPTRNRRRHRRSSGCRSSQAGSNRIPCIRKLERKRAQASEWEPREQRQLIPRPLSFERYNQSVREHPGAAVAARTGYFTARRVSYQSRPYLTWSF